MKELKGYRTYHVELSIDSSEYHRVNPDINCWFKFHCGHWYFSYFAICPLGLWLLDLLAKLSYLMSLVSSKQGCQKKVLVGCPKKLNILTMGILESLFLTSCSTLDPSYFSLKAGIPSTLHKSLSIEINRVPRSVIVKTIYHWRFISLITMLLCCPFENFVGSITGSKIMHLAGGSGQRIWYTGAVSSLLAVGQAAKPHIPPQSAFNTSGGSTACEYSFVFFIFTWLFFLNYSGFVNLS